MNSTELDRIFTRVADASRGFKRRWTLAALRRVDEDLFLRFEEQLQLYDKAVFLGDAEEIETQVGGMCRGWAAITARMEAAGAEPDAYLEGFDGRTGTRVRISDQREVCDNEDGVIWVTPDEVAVMMGSLDALRQLKALYPGATVEEVR